MGRWNGNGLADGVTLTTGNVNTAGNGDSVTLAVSGTPTIFRTAGDGFELQAGASVIARIDKTGLSLQGMVTQLTLTPRDAWPPLGEVLVVPRQASADASRLVLNADGTLTVRNSANANVPAGTSPALVLGHRYVIGFITQRHGSPTTTNGRVLLLVHSLTDPAWNGVGWWLFDSGETVNVGTSATTNVRFGKNGGGTSTIPAAYLFEQLGWDTVAIPAGVTGIPAVAPYFMPAPYPLPATAAGSLALSGAADAVQGAAATAVGGLSLAGTATATARAIGSAVGSLTLDGSASGVARAIATAAGVLTATGAAQTAARAAVAGSVTLGGLASVRVASPATGTLTLTGTASADTTGGSVERDAVGSLALGGTATAVPRVTATAVGGLTLTGAAAIAGGTAARDATGTLAVAGAASSTSRHPRTAAGALTITGSAAVIAREYRDAVATLTLAGTATVGSSTPFPAVRLVVLHVPEHAAALVVPARVAAMQVPERVLEWSTR